MSLLCDPAADMRCGGLDCSEPDYPRPSEMPWEALEESVFGGKDHAGQLRSVNDMPGLDSLLEAHGVVRQDAMRKSADEEAVNRRSREIKEQEDIAKLLREKRTDHSSRMACPDQLLLEKLKAAGATPATLHQVEAAIKRREDTEARLSARGDPLLSLGPAPKMLVSKENDGLASTIAPPAVFGRQLGLSALSRGIVADIGDSSNLESERTNGQELTDISDISATAGLGCTLERFGNGEHYITSVKKGSACDRGGLKPGMIIQAIDGVTIVGMNMKDVRQLSTGPLGSEARVMIKTTRKAAAEERILIRAGPGLTNNDSNYATSREPIGNKSATGTGKSWLGRLLGTNSAPAIARVTPSDQKEVVGTRRPQSMGDGKVLAGMLEYDKNGQPWTFDANTMAWTQVQSTQNETEKKTPPRVTYALDTDYDDRTDTSDFGTGPLTERSVRTPTHVNTAQPSLMRPLLTHAQPPILSMNNESEVNSPHNDKKLDDVVNQILERRSARLADQRLISGRPENELGGNTHKSNDTLPSDPAPRSRLYEERNPFILRSFDLQSSSLPMGIDDTALSTTGYQSRSHTPDDLSPQDLAMERKNLWQHLSELEKAVKALDVPSVGYAQIPYDDVEDYKSPFPDISKVSNSSPITKTQNNLRDLPEHGSRQLRVRLIGADHLPKMDAFGSCDPYVELKLGDQTQKSKTIQGTYKPLWNQDFNFEIPAYSSADLLTLSVFDWDAMTKDDYIGEAALDLCTPVSDARGTSSVKTLNIRNNHKDVIGHDKKAATLQVSFEFIAGGGSRAPPASSSITKPNLSLPVSAISAKGIKSPRSDDPQIKSPKLDALNSPKVEALTSPEHSQTPRQPYVAPPPDTSSQGNGQIDTKKGIVKKELPPEWTECWSKSKNRPYYKNKHTGQTVWHIRQVAPTELGAQV